MFPELELKEGWITVVCLLLILLCVAWSIQAARWSDGLAILQGVVLVGGVFGVMLAKSRLPGRLAHLLSMLAGFTWSAFLTSRVLADAWELTGQEAVIRLEWQIQRFFFVALPQGTRADNHIFLLLLALLLWLMAYVCAWAVFRWQRVWWATIVSGVSLMLNVSYAKGNMTGYVIGFLLFALLLVVRVSLASYEQEWRIAGVAYSPELMYSFLRAGLVFSVLAIFLAWATPEALAGRPLQQAWDKVAEPWRRFQDRSSEIFRGLNYQNEPAYLSPDLWMKFGGPPNLTDTPIVDVQAPTGRYWRVTVFQKYTSDGWTNTDTDTILIGENEQDLALLDWDLRQEVTQTITLKRDLGSAGTLVAAAQPLKSNLPLRAMVSYVPLDEEIRSGRTDSSLPPVPGDASILYSRMALKAGESYRVVSSVSKVDEESLRQAKAYYPSWVRSRYLQLPDLLPGRIRLLAEEITADQETAWDKAKAIEGYLRQIPYSDQIEGPTPGQDGVDYFLFDAKQGYCQYYASAMVVMLRTVGIPARYVQGYSQNVQEEGVYHILEKDGHAWPEVFFPDYGWIEFEPTGSEPSLDRPKSQDSAEQEARLGPDPTRLPRNLDDLMDAEADRVPLQPAAAPKRTLWQQIGRWGAPILAFLAAILVVLALFAIRRQRRIEGLSVVERVYEDLVEWVRRLLRIEPLTHQTPHEYAAVVAQCVPQGCQSFEQIVGLYVEERFGHKIVPAAEAEVAWQQARVALWHRWIGRRIDRLRHVWRRFVPPTEPQQPSNR
jgi:transglutaminase-like putative cysteine protease